MTGFRIPLSETYASPMAIPLPRPLDPQSVPSLRWGVIGPGEIASPFVRSVSQHTNQEIVTVASRSDERAQLFAERHGIGRVSKSYEDLCNDPSVDVVYVASHIAGHLDHARLAIEAGKHVLVEKPFSYSPEETEALLAQAKSAGVLAMEAMWTRYLPQSDVLRQLLDDGLLGDAEFLQATFAVDNRAISRMWEPGTGGIVFDMGIYPISFAHFFFGEPESVSAHGRVLPNGVDTGAVVVLNYPSGAQASLTMSGVATLPCQAAVSGSRAMITLDHLFFMPTTIRLNSKDLYFDGESWQDTSAIQKHDGLCYQASYLASYVANGLLESPVHSHREIVSNLRVAGEICNQLGATPWANQA
jgi:predicted dehydrogenase